MGERNYREEWSKLDHKLGDIQELAAALDMILFRITDSDQPLSLYEKRALFGVSNAIAAAAET
ncbi:MAG: hypothetical protein ACU0CB_04120 [Roseovarius sp.]|uniref:hypothetical protein n=1 Tax=Roseovarius sp. TaxID=1486281 RepID=UPI004058FEF4